MISKLSLHLYFLIIWEMLSVVSAATADAAEFPLLLFVLFLLEFIARVLFRQQNYREVEPTWKIMCKLLLGLDTVLLVVVYRALCTDYWSIGETTVPDTVVPTPRMSNI